MGRWRRSFSPSNLVFWPSEYTNWEVAYGGYRPQGLGEDESDEAK